MIGRTAAGSPLFLRIFVLMLMCVGVVQLMNLALLLAVRTPSEKLYTVGQIADAMRAGPSNGVHNVELEVSRARTLEPARWNPRIERIQAAMAMALAVPMEDVQISFPKPFLVREPLYDRASVPRPVPLRSRAAARDVVVIGNFDAAIRTPDGGWVRVQPVPDFEPWRWYGLIWLVIAVLAVAPFAWMLARRIAKPFDAFAAAADRLGRDPKAQPLTLSGPREITEAAAAFNRMQGQLDRYVRDRTTVIGSLAHDLRTPLMRLGLRLEAVPDAVRTACESDIRDMQAMISSTLAYVRDTGQPALRRPLDLRALAETVIDDMSDGGAAVALEPGESIVVEGNAAALKAMVTNLVSNAVKYAGGARVTLHRGSGEAAIEVLDDGPGIPLEHMDRMFEPFFRGEPSRNRDTGGIGLGLASARAVARAHGGDVTLINRPSGGLSARATLSA